MRGMLLEKWYTWKEACKRGEEIPGDIPPAEAMAGFLLETYGSVEGAIHATSRHLSLDNSFYMTVWGILAAIMISENGDKLFGAG